MASITDPNKMSQSTTDCDQLGEPMAELARRLGRPYDRANSDWQAELARVLELISDFSQPGRLLDLACGDGQWTSLLAKRASVVALDYSSDCLKENRRRWQQAADNEPLSCVRGDIFSLPFRTNSFDRCFCGFWLSLVPKKP